jgi:hypothetical protein
MYVEKIQDEKKDYKLSIFFVFSFFLIVATATVKLYY